jgi:molybdopterin synthase sulfur carrier subunit
MHKLMKIHVKYFASVRDLMETESKDLDIDKSLSVYELWKELTVKMNVPEDVLIAVNHKYVDKDFKLNDGDEVAYFPPVTGG